MAAPHHKDYHILGSTLRSPCLGKQPNISNFGFAPWPVKRFVILRKRLCSRYGGQRASSLMMTLLKNQGSPDKTQFNSWYVISKVHGIETLGV